jgi:hypothetical protein
MLFVQQLPDCRAPALLLQLIVTLQFSSVKKEWQAAWLLRAVQCIDLTTLAGDDTETNVNRLCFKAALPIREDIITALGVGECQIGVGAVCVYSARVREAFASLEGTGIPVAAVATGFPSGQTPLEQRLAEITAAVAAGAAEIDVVVSRPLVLTGNWPELYKCAMAASPSRAAFFHNITVTSLDSSHQGDPAHARCVRKRAHQGHSSYRRMRHHAKSNASITRVHDGWCRFHQDVHRQGGRQCNF